MMYVLGISALDKDVTLTLFERQRPIYAVSEERLTRTKRQDGFPWQAFGEMLGSMGISSDDIAIVAYPFYTAGGEFVVAARHIPAIVSQLLSSQTLSHRQKASSLLNYVPSLLGNYRCHDFCDRELRKGLRYYRLEHKLRRYDHELCHAAAAFFASGYTRALVQVSDWYGAGSSGGIYLGEDNRLTRLVVYRWPNSLGSFYARYTAALGFTPDHDEGKVLGLAAYGDPSLLYLDLLRDFTIRSDGSFEHSLCLDDGPMATFVQRYARADVAAALQQTFETVLTASIAAVASGTGISAVCLAGGSMANVKLNQRIRELEMIDDVYIFPAMADMGSGYGAACLALSELDISPRHQLTDLYLSRTFNDSEIEAALQISQCTVVSCDDIELEVARLLANRRIVGRWAGRMEFGPRALGNRSILAHPADVNGVDTLNRRLRRTEFMPFAPSVLVDCADKQHFIGIDQAYRSAPYMTMTFDVQPDFAKCIPAAVHIDGTARIQVVQEAQNPSFYKIIRAFYAITGIPAVINTSFNMHGEPIVYTPIDAIRTFQAAQLDALALGPYLLYRNDADSV